MNTPVLPHIANSQASSMPWSCCLSVCVSMASPSFSWSHRLSMRWRSHRMWVRLPPLCSASTCNASVHHSLSQPRRWEEWARWCRLWPKRELMKMLCWSSRRALASLFSANWSNLTLRSSKRRRRSEGPRDAKRSTCPQIKSIQGFKHQIISLGQDYVLNDANLPC